MQRTILFLLSICFLCACGHRSGENASESDKKHHLGFKLQKGNTHHIKTKATSSIKQTINGRQINMHINFSGLESWAVRGIHDKYFTVEIELQDIYMNMKTPRQNIQVNTEKEPDTNSRNTLTGFMSEYLRKMTEKSFTMQLTKNGKVKEISGVDKMYKSISSSFSSNFNLPPKQKQKAMKQLKKFFGKQSLRQNIEIFTHIYPREKVAVKDSWKNEIDLTTGSVKGIAKNTYTLTGMDADTIHIKGEGELKMNMDAMKFKNLSTSTNMDGSTHSTFKINPETGMVMKGTAKQQMKGDIVITSPQLPEKKKVPMEVTSKTHVRGSENIEELRPISE